MNPLFLFAFAAAGMLSGCIAESWEELVTIDPDTLKPPAILRVDTPDERTIELVFDEPAWIDSSSLSLSPALLAAGLEDGANVIRLRLGENGRPGVKYSCEGTVRDDRGNTMSFLYNFYGFNARVPRLLINEFISSGTEANPTKAEILVLTDGNLGGTAFFEGTKSYNDKMYVFPSCEVRAGDFILLHLKPLGDEGSVDESGDKTEATAKWSSPSAWDFWARDLGNLSPDNDVLSLYDSPEGKLLDGVLYTSKTYETGMKYNGFGTSLMLNKVKELVSDGGWKTAGPEPFPSDGLNPKGATSTRPLCRSSASDDTDGAADWHIVPTGKASFGASNSDERYMP